MQGANERVLQNRLETALLALAEARRQAELDLKAKAQALRQALGQVGVAESLLRAAEVSHQVAQARLLAGTGTPLDLLQAEVNLLQARRNLAQAQVGLFQAYYAWLEAQGESLVGGEL